MMKVLAIIGLFIYILYNVAKGSLSITQGITENMLFGKNKEHSKARRKERGQYLERIGAAFILIIILFYMIILPIVIP